MSKLNRRLPAETFSFTLGSKTPNPESGEEGFEGHHMIVSLAYDNQDLRTGKYGPLREVAFVGRGRIGQGVDLLFSELSIKLSRAIQGRDPDTGKELT